ncbi:BNR-4 repeat-containing protein [uncultured Arcticibacterium sp.]|uniref:BNR-4 repeat-containing protein n=1 Tax=uncultured Arcticibacterium sp. TaxID=2173042 RepID=UPI0030F8557B
MKTISLSGLFVFLISLSLSAQKASSYQTFSSDGAWCWFSDPRAVQINDKIYAGWVATDGSIMVASHNQNTGETKEVNISPQFNKDDHANPSFLVLPDKRLMVFFSAHSTLGRGEKEPAITYATTTNPEDISSWEPQKRLTKNAEGPMKFCYSNPVMLSEENNRIYLFWRGGDWKPTFAYTDNFGKKWSDPQSLIKSFSDNGKRPYVKISSNGKDEINFAFTDGHPRNEPLNSIYYLKYKAGKFHKADGTVVGSMESLPIRHGDCDVVFSSTKEFEKSHNGTRAWIWDIAEDEKGFPVMVYTRLPEESKHQYFYAKWDGSKWQNSKISEAGTWFPRYEKTKAMREPEPHYSGGIYLDHENTDVVYYSKPVGDVFEIFKAQTIDSGKTWEETAITLNSEKDNVRPYAIRGAGSDAKNQILWMQNKRYSQYTDYNTSIKIDSQK